MIAAVETHDDNKCRVEQTFQQHGFSASVSEAEKANTLTHGGEVIAVRELHELKASFTTYD
jgi:hypothetical protein